MSNSAQNGATETAAEKLSTLEHLIDGAKRSLNLPEVDLPFGQAISWLSKAEEVAVELGDNHMKLVADAYVDLILRACVKSQNLVMSCGHILRQHRDLSIAIEAALRKLARCRREQTSSLPSQVLDAQCIAEEMRKFVVRHLKVKMPYTDSNEFDRLMTYLFGVRDLILPMNGKCVSDYRSDEQTLNLAATALNNASYSIVRFFKFLSDYKKAATLCRWSSIVLLDVSSGNVTVLSEADRSILKGKLTCAERSLGAKNYTTSRRNINQALAMFKLLGAEF